MDEWWRETTAEAVRALHAESVAAGTHAVVEWAARDVATAKRLFPSAADLPGAPAGGDAAAAAEINVLLAALLHPCQAPELAEDLAIEASVSGRPLDAFDAALAALAVPAALRAGLQTVLGLGALPPAPLDALEIATAPCLSAHASAEAPADAPRRAARTRPSVAVVDVVAAPPPSAARRPRTTVTGGGASVSRPPDGARLPGVVLETPPRPEHCAAPPRRAVSRLSLA